MPRKGLDIAEALALFEELPSDDDSAATDESDTDEDYVPNLPQEETISSSDDEEISESEGSSSSKGQVKWSKCFRSRSLPDFREENGPASEVLAVENPTPLGIFLMFITTKLLEDFVFQTNLYATQEGKSFTPLGFEELLRFLAINLLMGVKRLPSYRDYWSNAPDLHDEYISQQMSVKRFGWILSHLHINDNSLQPKKGTDNFDKLYKIRPFLSHLSEKFLSLYRPCQNQAIDESMVKFKGRSSLKQYMPKKPIKRGYKVWMRCDESAFACQFEVYTGKVCNIAEKNLGERVVRTLCEPIFGKNHHLFMDNYFTSYNLFKFLDTQKIFACGTVNMTRINLPKILKPEKDLSRGEFDWASSEDDIICLRWKDKRGVCLLSSLDNATNVMTVERKERDGQIKIIPCPQAIRDYNQNMGFVDRFDHLKSLYEIDRKSHKWWHRLFFHFLDATVVNAYIIYNMLPGKCNEFQTMKDFRREIIRELLLMGAKTDTKKRRSSSKDVPLKKHKPYVPVDERTENAEHIPIKTEGGLYRRCALCSTRKEAHRSRWLCKKCNVPLCLQTMGATCFQKFHSK